MPLAAKLGSAVRRSTAEPTLHSESGNHNKIAETQPRTAYTAFTHGLLLSGTTSYESLTGNCLYSPKFSNLYIESAIQSQLIPAITGQPAPVRHNDVRDVTVSLLFEVCHWVTVDPHLQLNVN